MDQVTALPTTTRGNDAILVMVDKLSKMVHIAPCRKDCSAMETLHLFNFHVIRAHGMPAKVLTDRGKVFNNTMNNELWKVLGVRQALSSAFHPQTDGQTERINQAVEELLRHYSVEEQSRWDDYVFLVEFALNSHKNEATGHSAFQLVMGYNPSSPFDRVLGVNKEVLGGKHLEAVGATGDAPQAYKNEMVKDHMAYMQQAWKVAKDRLDAAARRMKAQMDKHRRPHQYKVGDWIWLATTNLKLEGVNNKLRPRWVGPFQVRELIGRDGQEQAVRIDLPPGSRVHNVFHVQLTRPYRGNRSCVGPHEPCAAVDAEDSVWIEGGQEFFVEKILKHRFRCWKRQIRDFLVKWVGFGDEHNTWEPETNLTLDMRVSNSILDQYLKAQGLAPTVLLEDGTEVVASMITPDLEV